MSMLIEMKAENISAQFATTSFIEPRVMFEIMSRQNISLPSLSTSATFVMPRSQHTRVSCPINPKNAVLFKSLSFMFANNEIKV